MIDLTEPDGPESPEDRLREDLLLKGVPPTDADLIAAFATRASDECWWPNGAELGPLADAARLDAWSNNAAKAFGPPTPEGEARLRLLEIQTMRGVIGPSTGGLIPPSPPREQAVRCVEHLRPLLEDLGLDVAGSLARHPVEPRLLDALYSAPAYFDQLPTNEVLDLDLLRAWNPIEARGSSDPWEPARLSYMLLARRDRAVADLLALAPSEADEALGHLAGALLQEIEHPAHGRAVDDYVTDPDVLRCLQDWALCLVERAEADETHEPFLLAATCHCAWLLEHYSVGGLDPELNTRVGELAFRALGRLRRHAREDLTPTDPVLHHQWATANRQALAAVARSRGLGAMLVSGVQLLRALRHPAVGADLRWWGEASLTPPPQEWCWLPSTLAALVHTRGRAEEAADPELLVAREALSDHLLGRLKPVKKGARKGDPTEPSAVWRLCAVRAAEDLGVNPQGRGHQVLHRASESDPDEGVCLRAKRASHVLRRAGPDASDASPRRRIITALWWLRQAHRMELGLDVDPSGARRTRQREVSIATDSKKAGETS